MLLFDISDDKVKVARVSAKVLGGESITNYLQKEIKEGLIVKRAIVDQGSLSKEISSLLGKNFDVKEKEECAFILHDERVYTLRLRVGQPRNKRVSEIIEEKVSAFIPEPSDTQIRVFKEVGEGEVQYIAVNKEFFGKYLELFNSLDLKPTLAVSEAYALFSLFEPYLKEGETVFYLNFESTVTDVVVMDKVGVLETFSEARAKEKLTGGLIEITSFLKERLGRTPGRIIFGGEGIEEAGVKEFAKNLNIEPTPAEKIFPAPPVKIDAKSGSVKATEILGFLGLSVLSNQKEPLNLIAP
ncbi:hypothetical protein GTO10_05695 [Candidatus Saccharibacteria bacterium]|nr:hypothetical protein [Candidatus Saccharibacteria bacterium]